MTMDADPTRATETDPAPSTAPDLPITAATAAVAAASVEPWPPVAASRRRSGGRWLDLLLGAAALIAVAGIAFAVGRSTAAAAVPQGAILPGPDGGTVLTPDGSFDPGALPGGGQGRPGTGGAGFLAVGALTIEGEVTAVDGSTLTIRLDAGETTTVTLDGSTTYHEATATDASRVVVGDDVAVRVSMDGGPGAGTDGEAPRLTASDVTVTR